MQEEVVEAGEEGLVPEAELKESRSSRRRGQEKNWRGEGWVKEERKEQERDGCILSQVSTIKTRVTWNAENQSALRSVCNTKIVNMCEVSAPKQMEVSAQSPTKEMKVIAPILRKCII